MFNFTLVFSFMKSAILAEHSAQGLQDRYQVMMQDPFLELKFSRKWISA